MLPGLADLWFKTDENQTTRERGSAGALSLHDVDTHVNACAMHAVAQAADGRTIACSANDFTTSCRKRGAKRPRLSSVQVRTFHTPCARPILSADSAHTLQIAPCPLYQQPPAPTARRKSALSGKACHILVSRDFSDACHRARACNRPSAIMRCA